MSEKLIIISSQDQSVDESNTNSDFVVNLKERYNTQNIIKVLVKSIQVPNVFYNVRGGLTAPGSGSLNNTLLMKETGEADATVSVAEGQYTTSTFIAALQAAMNLVLVASVVAIAQDTLTQRLTFTFTGATVILYNKEDGSLLADVAGITSTSVASAAITADSLPDLSGVDMAFVHSQDIAQAHAIDGDSGLISVVDSVSFHDTAFGATGFLKNDDDELSLIDYGDKPLNLSRIKIVLRDNLGARLDIGSSKMIVMLKCFYAMDQ